MTDNSDIDLLTPVNEVLHITCHSLVQIHPTIHYFARQAFLGCRTTFPYFFSAVPAVSTLINYGLVSDCGSSCCSHRSAWVQSQQQYLVKLGYISESPGVAWVCVRARDSWPRSQVWPWGQGRCPPSPETIIYITRQINIATFLMLGLQNYEAGTHNIVKWIFGEFFIWLQVVWKLGPGTHFKPHL